MKEQDFNIEKASVDLQENEICHKALSLINTIYKEDTAYEAIIKKEDIFKQIEKKIQLHEQRSVSLVSLKKWIWSAVASVILLCAGFSYIFYQYGYDQSNTDLAQTNIEVYAPFGTTTKIKLPDSSSVILNAGSRLIYPSRFQKHREVILIGEGFFDIEKNNIPFIIRTENLSVKVLGTRFNLRAFKNEDLTQITLEEGLIEVWSDKQNHESLQLYPNQQLTFNHQTGELKREIVNVENFTIWQRGKLVFNDLSLAVIAQTLERRFNTHIQINDPGLRNECYYVTFEHNESLDEILALLSYKRAWTYEKEGDIIRIISRK